MAALAYVLLPISGMLAFFSQTEGRVRFHGAQAVAFGLVWSLALYGCSAISATLTQLVFLAGAAMWIGLIITTATGRDLRLPVVGRACARAAGLVEDG
jgi:uncharacterized membrane protein